MGQDHSPHPGGFSPPLQSIAIIHPPPTHTLGAGSSLSPLLSEALGWPSALLGSSLSQRTQPLPSPRPHTLALQHLVSTTHLDPSGPRCPHP